MKEELSPNTIVLGHAGTALSPERAIYPPNSEKSITYALDALNADGVEVDIQLTKDSVLVLFHDDYMEDESCISSHTWEEIQTMNESEKHPILRLKTVLPFVLDRARMLMLDVKHYSFCNEDNVNYTTFNWALNNELTAVSEAEKEKLILVSRNADLLQAISDDGIRLGYESNDLERILLYQTTFDLDLAVIKLADFNSGFMNQLDQHHIDFCLFNLKTRGEISDAAEFKPKFVITDNISVTRKYFK